MSLRIVLNTNKPRHFGTRRLFFDDLADDISTLGAYVELDNWKEYDRFDVAILLCQDLAGQAARERNPDILVGLVHPSDITSSMEKETRNADFIISGSIEERDYYLKYNPNIFIVPHIEKDWRLRKQHAETDEITLGYHGNKIHLAHFYPNLTLALEALSRGYDIRLKAVYNIQELGYWKVGRPSIPISDVQWEYHTLGQELLECDVGLAPGLTPIPGHLRTQVLKVLGTDFGDSGRYPNDYVIRFKNSTNAGRALVFVQLGIPVVADMTPECCQLLHHGRTGFVVYSAEGWYDAIERLIQSAQLRQEVADNASDFLRLHHARETYVAQLVSQISSLLEQKREGTIPDRVRLSAQDSRGSRCTVKRLLDLLLQKVRR